MIAVAIRLGSGGPALMRLSCLGMNGRVFRQYRFRVIRGDLSAADLLHANAADAGHLTPLGAVMLSTGLNLLPQVLNVLRGDMSFIGPRAVAVAATDRRRNPITGCLRCAGDCHSGCISPRRSNLSESERMALSLAYVRCAGACTDGKLVLQSAARIFRRRKLNTFAAFQSGSPFRRTGRPRIRPAWLVQRLTRRYSRAEAICASRSA